MPTSWADEHSVLYSVESLKVRKKTSVTDSETSHVATEPPVST